MQTAIAQKPKFSVAIQTDGYKKLINNTLQDPKRAQRFIASISSAVAVNPALQECDAGTILSCALLGESLELSPSPQLGQFYLVPYDVAAKDANGKDIYVLDENGKKVYDGKYPIKVKIKKAQFQMGYKGYIQLALRSGYYKKFNVLPIKKGEFIKFDPFEEIFEARMIADPTERAVAETIGYYGMFEYLNGFRKLMYWTKEEMEQHALHYSKAYASDKKYGNSYSYWSVCFDDMALKTLIRQLISKWGMMSIEMRTAFEQDDAIINVDGTTEYIGGDDVPQIAGQIEASVQETDQPEADEAEQQTISMSDLQ